MQRDGVVEKELRSAFQTILLGIPRVPVKRARDIGGHEGSVVGRGLRGDSGQSGECILGADTDARDSAIGEDKNGSDGVDVLLDLSLNILLVELVLLKISSVGEARRVKDAYLGRR